jgi:hypothetical protein
VGRGEGGEGLHPLEAAHWAWVHRTAAVAKLGPAQVGWGGKIAVTGEESGLLWG